MAIVTISPAILSQNPTEYKQIIKDYYGFTKRAHIDVSDGTLTQNRTIAESAVWWPRGWSVDIHMMTAVPSQHLEMLIKLHPDMVILHAEANEDLLPIFDQLKEHEIKVGVAIVKSVFPGSIKAILNAADHALIFSGELGKQGGQADLLLLEKDALIKAINPSIEVGWDGGANLENIHYIAQAGVGVINVGGALMRAENKQEYFDQMNKETENQDPI